MATVLAGTVSLGVTLRIYLDILEGCFDVPTGAVAMKDDTWKMWVSVGICYNSNTGNRLLLSQSCTL